MADGVARGRFKTGPLSQEHRASVSAARRAGRRARKATAAIVEEIRRDTRTQQEIAADYGLNKSTVSRIKSYQIWR
jgi:DNA invertase Pin-like site-specific DNA recombinase